MISLVQLASDNFQRANEQPLNPTNWSTITGKGQLAVISQQCYSQVSGGQGTEEYIGIQFPNDQYCSVTIGALAASSSWDLFVRLNAAATQGYILSISPTSGLIFILPGTPLTGVAWGRSLVPGDVVTLAIQGSTISVLLNGALVTSTTDSTWATGSAVGLQINYNSTQLDTSATLFTAGRVIMAHAYDPTKPFLGSIVEGDAGPGDTLFVGTYTVITAAPAGLPNPYLGHVKKVTVAPPGNSNPSLGQVVVLGFAPAGAPDPALTQAIDS